MRDNSRPHAVENIGDISKGTAGSESTDCAERIALKQRKCKTGKQKAGRSANAFLMNGHEHTAQEELLD